MVQINNEEIENLAKSAEFMGLNQAFLNNYSRIFNESGSTMFGINRSSSKGTKSDEEYIKISSLIKEGSTLDRRKIEKERRLSTNRRKIFSSLFTGFEKRNKLKQRREVSCRRDDVEGNQVIESIDSLALNEKTINTLISEQVFIIKELNELLSLVKEKGFINIEEKLYQVYSNINNIMQKEEYFLCLYLDKNKGKISDVHIEKLLSIINSDISKLSNDVVRHMERYRIAKINQSNIGFVQLDMGIINAKFSACLENKIKHLYPIYITQQADCFLAREIQPIV